MSESIVIPDLTYEIDNAIHKLKTRGRLVDSGHWQGVPTAGKPDLQTKEILDLRFSAAIPGDIVTLERYIRPNLPWVEVEFLERVGGEPHNPHHSLNQWPYWRGQEGQTMYEGMFSHTYSERFWPKHAGDYSYEHRGDIKTGIRYDYGDLNDLINLLRQYPHTRQAYLPIFGFEDTGAVHGGRIPCTLGYHFLLRDNKLHCWYYLRSCDAVRHFRDDVYLACRLVQWVIDQLTGDEAKVKEPIDWADVTPGDLFFTAHSFHAHLGDWHLL